MRGYLIILLAFILSYQAGAQQNTSGTVHINKVDTLAMPSSDTLGNALLVGRCDASVSPMRLDPGILRNPIKSETVTPPLFEADGLNFEQYSAKYLRYPKLAKDNDVAGTIEVAFTIDVLGYARSITITKGIDNECDKEALRLLRRMPKWTPAKVNGESVICRLNKEITFELK